MNDPKSFLTRWSRRKRAAAANDEAKSFVNEMQSSAASSPANAEGAVESERIAGTVRQACDSAGLSSAAVDSVDPPFDPLSVPRIESITADTDVRRFLAPGVPPELTRAALRRAWTADPKIRDFVGLADYDWDFNTPGTMAGFGSLEMTEDLCRVAASIIGRAPSPGEPDMMAQAQPVRHEVENTELAGNAPIAGPKSSGEADDLRQRAQESRSAPSQTRKPDNSQLLVARQSHGGALPK
jgi:Protein of unknown function (DUF3306)